MSGGEPADDISALSINYIFYALLVDIEFKGPFEKLFNMFWNRYLERTGDEEVLTVIQPFYAWRGLVVASPIWYPNLSFAVRKKLLNFITNVLQAEKFDIKSINAYTKS